MARFALTYKTSTTAARMPDVIVADDYVLNRGFFIFTIRGDDSMSPSTVVNQVAANAVLHIERLRDQE